MPVSTTREQAAPLLRRAHESIRRARECLQESGAAAWRQSWIPLGQAAADIQALNLLLHGRGAGADRELLQPALELRQAIRTLAALVESAGGYTVDHAPVRAAVSTVLVEG